MQCHFRQHKSHDTCDANHAMWRPSPPLPSSPHRWKLNILNFTGDIVWHAVPQQPISVEILPTSVTWISHWVKTTITVWIPWSSYNTTLYTMGLFYEHRYGVVKFSNISWTWTTTDTVHKGWLNLPWLMTENGKPLFLLTLLAKANCGWHGVVWHN